MVMRRTCPLPSAPPSFAPPAEHRDNDDIPLQMSQHPLGAVRKRPSATVLFCSISPPKTGLYLISAARYLPWSAFCGYQLCALNLRMGFRCHSAGNFVVVGSLLL